MWERYRKDKLERYIAAKRSGEVDKDIVPLLDLINSIEGLVTLSSCSGRIAVIDTPEIGDKQRSSFLGKWHCKVGKEEVVEAAKRGRFLSWFIQYPPIIHLSCKNIEFAEVIMKVANNTGFRRSGIISLKNHVVEIASLERIELPIARSGRLIISESYLEEVVALANKKLSKGKQKLERLFKEIKALKTFLE
ncbi:tRNA(Phe) 7-((3-amino-3-carboxypropyl)-4-demethylwyosine(37)-N(4))-methyltransferase [Archaeoglobus neptunius]|uniref:tRNA(Phe) 7-((3-amino-3-carboxypropyl)-4-demethylwyosine(37)-N(4))- methyltransferase n=1 Tax=Archaeoglobus neptunius TaxID=2798580 RepID=UPI001E52766B|nr:hypothetical protein [Archaeoglobus neptunius]